MKRKKILAAWLAVCIMLSVISPAVATNDGVGGGDGVSVSDSVPETPDTPSDPAPAPDTPADNPAPAPEDPAPAPEDPAPVPGEPGSATEQPQPGEQPPEPPSGGEQPAEETPAPALPKADVEIDGLLDRLGATQTLFEFWDALQILTAEEWSLLADYDAEVYAQYREIASLAREDLPAPEVITVTEGDENTPIPFTDVADLLPPVEGEPLTMMDAFQISSFAILPMSVEQVYNTMPGGNPNGMVMNKTAVREGDKYKITLESYVTGEFKPEEIITHTPADIVLVLDESGSMSENINIQTVSYTKFTKRFRDIGTNDLWTPLNPSEPDPAKKTFTQVTMTRANGSGNTYDYTFTYQKDGNTVTLYSGRHDRNAYINASGGPAIELYTKGTTTTTKTKRDALQDSVNSFIGRVKADNVKVKETSEAGHRVAVVGFAGPGDYNTGSTYEERTIQELQSADTIGAISLNQKGATRTDKGLERAKIIMENAPATSDAKRNKVVILFTDGVPTTHRDFSTTVANTAIGHAYTLKNTYKASVYTIGIFSGANVSDIGTTSSTTNANRFMHFVSSNAPKATSMSTTNAAAEWSNKGFYLVASSDSNLDNIFEALSKKIESGNPAQEGLGADTVLKDVISDYFDLVPSSITVSTANATGGDAATGYTFGTPTPGGGTAAVSGDTIAVTGFDYSAKFVGKKEDGTYVGQKIIVTLEVNPKPGFFGGNQVPTNENTSGIYKPNDQTPVGLFPEPDVDVPIVYQIGSRNQAIYLGNTAELGQLMQYQPGYAPDGWNNAYVNINYRLEQGNTLVGSYAVNAGSAAGNWAWTAGQTGQPALENDTTYTLSCVVTPRYHGTQAGPLIPAQSPTVYVYKPQLTLAASDIWADYGKDVPLNTWAFGDGTTAYAPTLNGWVNAAASLANIQPTGPIPAISGFTYGFTKGTGDAGLNATTNTATTGKKDTEFTAALTGFAIGGNPFGAEKADQITYSNDGKFTLHPNKFGLTVTKQVHGKPGAYSADSFLFQLSGGTGNANLTIPFSLSDGISSIGSSKTITGLLCGQEYTVSERGNWSWRYHTPASQTLASGLTGHAAPAKSDPHEAGHHNQSFTFANQFSHNKWLTDSDGKANIFGAHTA